ncbi:cell envelope integrity protein TolA [Marinobacter alexandrii]|uniref:cell envelope integrity protein TolA n=1 Tax=Marinobacter alexandrii TaxID=2570351 RepID=UPI003D65BA87
MGHEREVTSTGVPPWKSPVALSLILHLVIAGVALAGWTWSSPEHEPPPRSISARLVTQQQPEPSPIETLDDQPDRDEERRLEEQKRKAEQEQKRKAEQERKEEARKLAEQKAREEAERKAQEQEQERKRQLAEKRKREEAAKAKEAARQKAEAEAKERERQKAEAEKKRKEEQRKAEAEAEQKRKEEQRKREEEARKEAERKRQEAERRLKEKQLEALAEEASEAKQAEARRQAQAAAAKAREAQMLTESEKYQALIRERLSQAWYPPSSATEEMTARLQITLLPTGELAGVKLVSSSGNTAFDNSALSAVRSLSRYPIPDKRDTFERYFRQFTIEFNPRRLK